jgi:hypothetical protein
MLEQSITEYLSKSEHHQAFRMDVLASDWFTVTTLGDILDNPQQAFRAVRTQRGLGSVSIARLRQQLARAFAATYCEDWEAAQCALRSGRTPQSPLAQKLANFITEWKVTAESISLSGSFYPANAIPAQKIYKRLAAGETFVIACETIPEVIKTPAIRRAEAGDEAKLAHVTEKMVVARNEMEAPTLRAEVVIDRYVLEDLLNGTRRYSALSEQDRIEQFLIMYQFFANEPNQSAYVADCHAVRLSPAILIGDGPLMRYSFGGFMEVNAPDLHQLFRARVAEARAKGKPLEQWWTENRDHPILRAAVA